MNEREEEDARPTIKITDKRRGRGRSDDANAGAEPAPVKSADVVAAEAEAAEYRDHLLRLQADFDNYRKRATREREQAAEFAAMPVVDALLGVVDDFELALMSVERVSGDNDAFLRGVELVYAKFVDALRVAGVEKLDPLGQPFDPEQHEALLQEGEGDGEPVVCDVLRPGYTMKGRVIRPAQVKVKKD